MKKLLLLLSVVTILYSCLSTRSGKEKIEREAEEKEKYDNPMARDKEEADKIKDPALGYVPYNRLKAAIDRTIELKQERLQLEAQKAQNTQQGSFVNPLPNTLQTPPLTWIERGPVYDSVGPSNGNTRGGANTLGGHTSGRIRAILVDTLNDPTGNTVFVGGIAGGLWKCTNFMSTINNWVPLDDRFNNLAISSICQDPTNASIIYFSTGEPADNADRVVGAGVWKSTNGGTSFTWLPATANYMRCFKIACDAAGNVYLACRTTTIPVNQQSGLIRSTDGGNTWNDITPNNLDVANTGTSCTDFEFTSSGIINAMFGYRGLGNKVEHRYSLTPTTVTPGTWLNSTGFRTGTGVNSQSIRTEMAVSGNILYAICINTAYNTDSCYKSVNGGVTWTKQNTTILPAGLGNGQGWYSMSLAINPSNTAEVISGGLDGYRSINNGTTWTVFTHWTTPQPYVHADHHFAQYWFSGGQTRIIMGTDGGIFYSANNGLNFTSKNRNLGIKQFYSAAIHPTAGSVYAIAGAQDNGVHQLKNAGLSYSFEVTGGDGMIVHINQLNPLIQFGSYVYNDYRRTTNGGNTWSTTTLSNSQGLFVNPFDNDDAQNIMYCSNGPLGNLRRWTGNTAGTTNTTITIGALGAANSITSVKVSPYTANRIFIGSNTGKIFRIENANTITSATSAANTTDISGALFPVGTIACVNTGTNDNNIIAVYSNYGVNNVWITTDGGTNWTAIDGNLPDMPIRWAMYEPGKNSRVYLSTEAGIYTTDIINGASTVWWPETTFPTVSTYMMKMRTSDSTIVVGTHGRGLWTAKIPPCFAASVSSSPGNTTACEGTNAVFTVSASGSNLTYQWQVSTDGGGSFNPMPGENNSTLTVNAVTVAMNGYQYRCEIDGTCTNKFSSAAGILTVKTTAFISSQPQNKTVCNADNTSFTVGITGSSDTYQWQVSTDAGNTYTDIPGANAATLSLTGVTNSMNGYYYRCIITTPCSGQLTSNAALLKVNPVPTVNAVSAFTVCNNATTGMVSFSGTVPGTVYNWTNSNTSIGLGASGVGNLPSFTATNATNAPITGTITVTPTYTNNGVTCQGSPTSFTITVNPQATVDPVANQVLCNGGTTTAIVFSSPTGGPGTIVYNWTHIGAGIGLAPNGAGNIPSFTAINVGSIPVVATIFITPVYTNNGVSCQGTVRTFTITVNPTPTVNAVNNQTVCNNTSTAAVSFSGFVPGTVFNWVNNTPSIGLAASGTGNLPAFTATNATAAPVTATITVTPSYTNAGVTCTGATTSFTITVNPSPAVNAVANQTVCNGTNTATVNFSSPTAGTVFNWTNNNTSIGLPASGTGNIGAFTAINTGALPVTATITVTPSYSNGGVTCIGTAGTFTITVNASPTIDAVPDQLLCNGSATAPITLTGPVSGAFYTWTNNNPAIGLAAVGAGNIPSFTATNTTAATLTATIVVTGSFTNGGVTCTGPTRSFTITVNPTPSVNAISNQAICNGATTAAVTISGAVPGTVFNWTNNNPSIGLATGGTGNISAFTAINNTNAPVTDTITITPVFTSAGLSCTGTPLNFTITVNPAPIVNGVSNQVLCNGSSTGAVNFSSPTAGATFTWTNNNTSIGLPASGTGNIPSFTATNTTNAPVTATVTVSTTASGCTGAASTSFTITVNPTPAVNQPANQSTCNGSNTAAINFTGTIASATYSWVNSDPSIGLAASGTGNIPSFTAVNTTQSPVTATITVTPAYTNSGTSCTGPSKNFTITVNQGANVVFTNAPLRVCLTDTLVLLKATPAGGTWSGRGITGSTFSATLAGLGVSTISYTVANGLGCTATSYVNITVNDCIDRHNGFATGIRLYPNPNRGQFYLRLLSDLYTEFDARVIDASGRVYSNSHFTGLVYGSVIPMNMGMLSSGTYFLEVYNTKDKARFEFVIVH